MREMLHPRRRAITMELFHTLGGNAAKFSATFGFNDSGHVREVFCLCAKSGTDLQSLLHHSLIVMSLGLQHGVSMAEYCRVLGEDQPAPPRSIIGCIVRTGANLDAEASKLRTTPEAAQ